MAISDVNPELDTGYQTLVAPELHPDIAIAHSGRDIGNTDPRFSEPEQVQLARYTIQKANAAADEVFVMRPLGGTTFTDLTDSHNAPIEEDEFDETAVVGDGLITRDASIGLMLNAADCIPLAVYQPDQRLLALMHLGWRGASGQLHNSMLEYMVQRHGFQPGGALAYIGPSILKESYTTESLSETQQTDPDWADSVEQRGDTYHIDIPGFVIRGLSKFGIPEKSIVATDIDTGAETNHYSFTRHKRFGEPNGRNGFLVTIKH